MKEVIKKLYFISSFEEKKSALVLFFFMLFSGIFGMASIASVLPFLEIITDQSLIRTNPYVFKLYSLMHFENDARFLVFLGVLVFLTILVGICGQAMTSYLTVRYTYLRGENWSSRLMRIYLMKPYYWFLRRNSSDLGKSILSEVEQVIHYTLLPLLQLFSGSIQLFFVLALMIYINPIVTVSASFIIGSAYISIYWRLRRHLLVIGEKRIQVNQLRYQILQETFGGIKEVKAGSLEKGFLSNFQSAARNFAVYKTYVGNVSSLPKFIIQGLSFGGIIGVLLYLIITENGNLSQIVPIMGVFVFSAIRLLPVISLVYQSVTKIKAGKPALEVLFVDFKSEISQDIMNENYSKLGLQSCIRFSSLEYRYFGSDNLSLKINELEIPARSVIGVTGTSGAGKTTMVDIILGLLEPSSGEMLVDGVKIDSQNVISWRNTIGYVPQNIFLSDDSILANIAFGTPMELINKEAVYKAAKMACIHEFIESNLEDGYNTYVGERGVRISGGQRQRLGIARALYHNPDVIVLDEATSALDNSTEMAVMDSIKEISTNRTVIVVAHRLSSLKKCDSIIVMDKGEVNGFGSFKDLYGSNKIFSQLVDIHNEK